MKKNDVINFKALEKELQAALIADEKYKRENAAKLRAVEQKGYRPCITSEAAGTEGQDGRKEACALELSH